MATILGLSGGPNILGVAEAVNGFPRLLFHDSAAALVRDGRILHAVEEERVSRIKHTNHFPVGAIRECLSESGVSPREVDHFSFFFEESFCDSEFRRLAEYRLSEPHRPIRSLVASNISEAIGIDCSPEKVRFVHHHDAHCAAAFAASSLRESLILVIDGRGEYESTSVYSANYEGYKRLAIHTVTASLGWFYHAVTRLLGFGDFDEYKVMGLAPYGDATRYRESLSLLYTQDLDGNAVIDSTRLRDLWPQLAIPHRTDDKPILQAHMDFAAAAQLFLEDVCLDITRTWQHRTGLLSLCLTGGVAQNCVMNGMLARSGLFRNIYVHPAPHDAGAAIGAALCTEQHQQLFPSAAPMFAPFLGLAISNVNTDEIRNLLEHWRGVLEWEMPPDIHVAAAASIVRGNIIGWARGRAEFGPRALGARSILADPRFRENRDLINRAIKRREEFRPFAPSVLEEYANQYFDLPSTDINLSEMCCVVNVRKEWRDVLGGVTHIDGSARVQLVSRTHNPDFWSVVSAFNDLAGVAILLNTSFNNSYEPIVHSPKDALRTFLTSDLHCLILGPYLIRKVAPIQTGIISKTVCLLPGTKINPISRQSIRIARGPVSLCISGLLAERIASGDSEWLVLRALAGCESQEIAEFMAEVSRLWEHRLVDIVP